MNEESKTDNKEILNLQYKSLQYTQKTLDYLHHIQEQRHHIVFALELRHPEHS